MSVGLLMPNWFNAHFRLYSSALWAADQLTVWALIFQSSSTKTLVFFFFFFLLWILSWQDIVVGAPQYFDRSGDIGGAVYIYMNRQGNWAGVKPLRLNGTTDSMFGLAVKNIGDINQDGYPGKWKQWQQKCVRLFGQWQTCNILPFDCLLQKEQKWFWMLQLIFTRYRSWGSIWWFWQSIYLSWIQEWNKYKTSTGNEITFTI